MPMNTPFIDASPFNGIYMAIGFVNSGFPDANVLYRIGPDGQQICLSRSIVPNGSFADFTAASGVQYLYIGTSIYDGGQETRNGNPVTATLNLNDVVIHKVGRQHGHTNNADGDNFFCFELINPGPQRKVLTREANVMRMAALEKPRIKTAPHVAVTIECPIIILNKDRAAVMPAFEEFLWSDELWCYRDQDGEKRFVTVPNQETRTDINVEMTLVLVESAYNEDLDAVFSLVGI